MSLLLAGGLAAAGALSANSNTNKAIKSQKTENDKNRQYNLELAKKQNQWSIDQWNRENAYNSYSNQIAMAKQAGLNPDLLYGQGAAGIGTAGSADMTSGASSDPVDVQSAMMNKMTLGDALNNAQALKQADAQTKLINAQTRKVDAETNTQEITNDTLPEVLRTGLEKTNGEIKKLDSDVRLSDSQRAKLSADIDLAEKQLDVYDSTIDKMKAEMSNLTFQQAMARADHALKSLLNKATINKLSADTGKSYAETETILKSMPAVIYNLYAQGENLDADTDNKYVNTQRSKYATQTDALARYGLTLQNGMLELDYSTQKHGYNTIEKANQARDNVDYYTGGLGSALEILNFGLGKVVRNAATVLK